MRNLFIYFALVLTQFLNAQIKQIGETDLSDFPSIKFKLHSRTFEKLNASDFTFSEVINGKENKIKTTLFSKKLQPTPRFNPPNKEVFKTHVNSLSKHTTLYI